MAKSHKKDKLCYIMINNALANMLAEELDLAKNPNSLKIAKSACRQCGDFINLYINSNFSDSDLVDKIDAAGVRTIADTGIGCGACKDMGKYAQAVLIGDEKTANIIRQKYEK